MPRGNSHSVVDEGGKHTANYRSCITWKEAKAALQRKHPSLRKKALQHANTFLRKLSGTVPLLTRWTRARGGITLSVGACCLDFHHSNQIRNLSPQPITKAPKLQNVITNRKTPWPRKTEPKSSAATMLASGKPKKKAGARVKTVAAKPTKLDLEFPNQNSTSIRKEISDLLDRLPLPERVEQTRSFLLFISSLLNGAVHLRAVLKTVILFVAEYSSKPLEGRNRVELCESPPGMPRQSAAERLNWSILSTITV